MRTCRRRRTASRAQRVLTLEICQWSRREAVIYLCCILTNCWYPSCIPTDSSEGFDDGLFALRETLLCVLLLCVLDFVWGTHTQLILLSLVPGSTQHISGCQLEEYTVLST